MALGTWKETRSIMLKGKLRNREGRNIGIQLGSGGLSSAILLLSLRLLPKPPGPCSLCTFQLGWGRHSPSSSQQVS